MPTVYDTRTGQPITMPECYGARRIHSGGPLDCSCHACTYHDRNGNPTADHPETNTLTNKDR